MSVIETITKMNRIVSELDEVICQMRDEAEYVSYFKLSKRMSTLRRVASITMRPGYKYLPDIRNRTVSHICVLTESMSELQLLRISAMIQHELTKRNRRSPIKGGNDD